jgi:8-oxo-dGTP pyrophosphatase MutT (NUDIX family)
MERYRTMRAFSAGGVVFRLVPLRSSETGISTTQTRDRQQEIQGTTVLGKDENQGVEVVLVGRSRAGIWALPKGTPQSGETIEQVAIREVQEETGLQVRLISYVGCISYSFVHNQIRYQKQVRHFLFESVGGDTALHDHEYDKVEWFSVGEASRRMTYQNEVYILEQAIGVLQRWLEYQRKEGRK